MLVLPCSTLESLVGLLILLSVASIGRGQGTGLQEGVNQFLSALGIANNPLFTSTFIVSIAPRGLVPVGGMHVAGVAYPVIMHNVYDDFIAANNYAGSMASRKKWFTLGMVVLTYLGGIVNGHLNNLARTIASGDAAGTGLANIRIGDPKLAPVGTHTQAN